MTETKDNPSFLEFLPVSLFGAIMSMAGLSFAWGWAEKAWGIGPWARILSGWITILLFVVLFIAYLVKWFRFPDTVRSEFRHPVSISYFGTFIVCLVLLPGIIRPYSQPVAIGMWTAGAVLMFVFAVIVLRKWLGNQQDPANALPAWIIPIVGTLDVPLVGSQLPLPGIHEACLLFFGIGLSFAIILITLILSRLFFHPPLPEAIQPSLMILVGPFALATSGYDALTGSHDIASAIFFYTDLFLLFLFGTKLLLLPKCCPFRVTWWAVSFPLVAITIAAFRYTAPAHFFLLDILPALLLTISTVVIVYLMAQTFYRLFTRRLLLPNKAAEAATRTLTPLHKVA